MSVSVFKKSYLAGLFGDEEMGALWDADAQILHMKGFEVAWARALGEAGVVTAAQAETAANAITNACLDVEAITKAMNTDGVPIPELVRQLKSQAPESCHEAIHKGATSQDVVDTALALTLRQSAFLIVGRLMELQTALKALEVKFGDRRLMGRTRMQAATEIKVKDRVKSWYMPIDNHLRAVELMRDATEILQYGGASGNRGALGDKAELVNQSVAKELGLQASPKAWHAMREGIAGYASLLSILSGCAGKFGQDVVLMAQQGIEEIKLSGGGGSSAMPHKQNPIKAELLVTLGRFNATQVSGIHQALIHEQERSGAAWALEWMILPQMAMATARSLAVAIELCEQVEWMGAAQP